MNVEVEISGATTHPHCPVATIHCVIDNDDEKNDDEDDDDGDCVESGGDAEYGRKIGLDDADDVDDDDDANDDDNDADDDEKPGSKSAWQPRPPQHRSCQSQTCSEPEF